MVRDRCARMNGAGRTKHTSDVIHQLSKEKDCFPSDAEH